MALFGYFRVRDLFSPVFIADESLIQDIKQGLKGAIISDEFVSNIGTSVVEGMVLDSKYQQSQIIQKAYELFDKVFPDTDSVNNFIRYITPQESKKTIAQKSTSTNPLNNIGTGDRKDFDKITK